MYRYPCLLHACFLKPVCRLLIVGEGGFDVFTLLLSVNSISAVNFIQSNYLLNYDDFNDQDSEITNPE